MLMLSPDPLQFSLGPRCVLTMQCYCRFHHQPCNMSDAHDSIMHTIQATTPVADQGQRTGSEGSSKKYCSKEAYLRTWTCKQCFVGRHIWVIDTHCQLVHPGALVCGISCTGGVGCVLCTGVVHGCHLLGQSVVNDTVELLQMLLDTCRCDVTAEQRACGQGMHTGKVDHVHCTLCIITCRSSLVCM